MKILLYIFATFLLTTLSGCMFAGNPLSKLWFYTYSNGRTTGRDTLLTPASFLELRADGNGFGLKHVEDLPAEWRSYFFDAEDCQKANDMIKEVFDHQNIAWAHTDSKYKMFLSAFQQMENFFR